MADNLNKTAAIQGLHDKVQDAVESASYLAHLLKEKPVMVAASAILSQVLAKLAEGLPDHLISLGALSCLVFIDWLTKMRACRITNTPITSKIMREKGVSKLKDYFILYIVGALSVPLFGDVWGYRTVLFAMTIWEIWSIAENLHDCGTIPFDIRQIAMFDGIKEWVRGGKLRTPFDSFAGGSMSFDLQVGPQDPVSSGDDESKGNLPI